MKKFFFTLVVVVIMVACGNQQKVNSSQTSRNDTASMSVNFSIGVVDVDSILQNYKFATQANEKLMKKGEDADLSLKTKARQLANEMEDFQKKTGKPPYKQVKGDMTFADYLKSQSKSFQREWLGKMRFEFYQSGKLSLDQMVHPDKGFKRTISELKKIVR